MKSKAAADHLLLLVRVCVRVHVIWYLFLAVSCWRSGVTVTARGAGEGDNRPSSPFQSVRQRLQVAIAASNAVRVHSVIVAASSLVWSRPSIALTTTPTPAVVDIPLSPLDGVYTMNYSVSNIPCRGIVDTGSPFLIAPSICTGIWGGCFDETNIRYQTVYYRDAGLDPTVEVFGGQFYDTCWKSGDVEIAGRLRLRNMIFGSVGTDIFRPPGGCFVGLIKKRTQRIRPTFLEQTDFQSFCFDIAKRNLRLSRRPLIPANQKKNVLPLVDLSSISECPVSNYAVLIKKLEINGKIVASYDTIYCIFDSGTSSCSMSDDLINDEATPNPIRKVRITFMDANGEDVVIEAGASRKDIFIVTAAQIAWFKKPLFNSKFLEYKRPQIVVAGCSLLQSLALTVDIDARRLMIERDTP
jgi:hypothetical protein